MVTLLYSGNMGVGHGLATLVRAVGHINGDLDLRVLIAGDGKDRERIANAAREMGLSNIEFRPPVALSDLADLLALGDIHYVSQRAGTQGVILPSKIYSVLAAGRPTLFVGPPDCEAAAIVEKSKSGIVVEPGDVPGVAAAIRILAGVPRLREALGRRARAYYEENFGLERSVSRIVRLIESLG